MKKLFFLLLPALLFAACTSNTATQNAADTSIDSLPEPIKIKVVEIDGLYANNHFLSCEYKNEITITDETKKIDSLYKTLLPAAYAGQSIYLKIKGTLSTQGTNASLTVTEVLKAEQKNERNTCIPYDYWCMGNEPFWRIQISESEKLIDFYDPMAAKYTHFMYVKPTSQQNSTVYAAETDGNKIKITITNQKCSDGMSERSYSCKAEVLLNGKTYKGCAVKFGEVGKE